MKTLFFLIIAAVGFGDSFILENQSAYPNKIQKSKMAIQWAASAKEVNDANHAVLDGEKLDPGSLHIIAQSGKIKVLIPKHAEYFRVVAFSKGQEVPDFLTNWIDIEPNKVYTLEDDHLVPSVLMPGTGC